MQEQAIIHCKPEYADKLFDIASHHILDMYVKDDEAHIIVDDVPYDPSTPWIDPDVQLCDVYGIDYDQVNCIEAYEDPDFYADNSIFIEDYAMANAY